MFDTGQPTGVDYELDGKTYTIQPRLLSAKVIDLLKRKTKAAWGESIRERQRLLADQREVLGEESVLDAAKRLAEEVASGAVNSYDGLGDPQTLAQVYRLCCDEILSDEEAYRVVASFDDLGKAIALLEKASGEEESKNSPRPGENGATDETDEDEPRIPAEALAMPKLVDR